MPMIVGGWGCVRGGGGGESLPFFDIMFRAMENKMENKMKTEKLF